jgi:hypothetical protein
VPFFDRKLTVSGMTRGEQRRIYDQRQRDKLPENGYRLGEIKLADLQGPLGSPGERARDDAPATTPKWVTHGPPKRDGFLPY